MLVRRYSHANFPNIIKLADGLKEIGARHNATGGQVALAWLLAQGDDIIPIPGTTHLKVCTCLLCVAHLPHFDLPSQYLEENLDAVNVNLTPEELQEVRQVAEKADAAQGGRYDTDQMVAVLFGDTPPLEQ